MCTVQMPRCLQRASGAIEVRRAPPRLLLARGASRLIHLEADPICCFPV